MRRFAMWMAFLPMMCAPTMAQNRVEYDTGSHIGVPERARIPESAGLSDADRGRIAIAAFANCVLARSGKQVAAVLQMPLGDGYQAALRRIPELNSLPNNQCLSAGEIQFNTKLIRGALFAALWKRRLSAEKVGHPWSPVIAPFDPNAPLPADPEAQRLIGLLWFADCVVKRDGPDASEVVAAPPASKQQNDAYVRLTPQLGPCFPQDAKLGLSKAVLEGALAEVLYRAPTRPASADPKAQ